MERRSQILHDCPEEFEKRLNEIIDDFESGVNDAKAKLEEIKAIDDLHLIKEALGQLQEMSRALY
jgi:hypothetical protein